MRVDAIDRQIIAELERDGRLSVADLAARVQLTAAPCSRRLRELERSGVIVGYRAVVDRAQLGLNFEALVNVTMGVEDAKTIAAFEAGIADVPEVRHAERLFGDPDYLLRVVARDIGDYASIRDEKIATLPGVQRITSTIVMRQIVDSRPLSISPKARGSRKEQKPRRRRL
jgi:DNA-binding Lrp family transcriptional regulator